MYKHTTTSLKITENIDEISENNGILFILKIVLGYDGPAGSGQKRAMNNPTTPTIYDGINYYQYYYAVMYSLKIDI